MKKNRKRLLLCPIKLFWLKILKFFDADLGWKKFRSGIRDGKNSDPRSGMKKIQIRDKHPGSATLN
jgi:hypothetical protein